MTEPMYRRLLAEGLGSAFLLATVIGSGVMGAKLAGGNMAIALLGNTVATGAMLVVLITIFGPVSGAHFNPAVTLAMAMRGAVPWHVVGPCIFVQIMGSIIGVWAAHVMFDLPVLQLSTTIRTGTGQWFAEFVATFGLLLTILGCVTKRPDITPFAVGLFITAAYWFTASTSFANPAVSIARGLSDTFAGIAPENIVAFILAQLAGMLAAVLLAPNLWPNTSAD